MKLTKEQWAWLVKAPEKIECGNGNYYKFIQTWDDNGDPIVEMIKYGNQYIKEILSPHRKLNDYFRAELHYVWEVWKAQQQKLIILKALRDSYANLTAENMTEKEFDNLTNAMRVVKNCSIPDVVKSLPNDDEIEQAANENADRIFGDDIGSNTEWYAMQHGFTDGVEWLKNYLAK